MYDLPWSRPLPHPPQPGATLQSSGYMSDTSGAQYACIPVTDQYNNTSMFSTVRGHPQVTNRGPPQSHSLCTSGSCLHHYMTAGGGLLTLPGVNHDRHLCSRQAHTLPIDPHNDLLIPLNCNGKVSKLDSLWRSEVSSGLFTVICSLLSSWSYLRSMT